MRPVTDLERRVAPFKVVSDYQPSGDQPTAIEEISKRIQGGEQDVVLLGATGTGKTATVAWVAEQLQRPVLVLQPNKTLAAQFANELRQLFPDNAVEYFVSYYDYYQPEAYVPQTDTYIEKDSSINEEVERLRHSATNSLLTRRDAIVVSTVSCIYGLGTPQEYVDRMLRLKVGEEHDRDSVLRRLVEIQYTRNDMSFTRGTFRVRGDTLEIFPVYEELAIRIEFFGDEVERLMTLHPITGEVISEDTELHVFPATHYVAGPERMERAIKGIELELDDQLATFEKQGKLLEAQRLRMRTTYDVEMMRQVGSCSGIENYSMHMDGRSPGSAPNTLLDYFPEDFVLVVDESHVAVPADRRHVRGRHVAQAQPRRPRLPAAERDGQPAAAVGGVPRPDRPDDLPLGHPGQLRARQGRRRRQHGPADHPPDRPGRPRGRGQVDQGPDRRPDPRDPHPRRQGRARPGHHADQEDVRGPHRLPPRRRHPHPLPPLRGRHAPADRAAARPAAWASTTSSSASTCCARASTCPRCRWWRSSTPTRRASCAPTSRSSRPSAARPATCPARSTCTPTRSRPSMESAIDETNRRRAIQVAYNTERGIDPQPLRKKIADITEMLAREDENTQELLRTWADVGQKGRAGGVKAGKSPTPALSRIHAEAPDTAGIPSTDLAELIQALTDQMKHAAADLQFEVAARLRDEIGELKKELRQMMEATK